MSNPESANAATSSDGTGGTSAAQGAINTVLGILQTAVNAFVNPGADINLIADGLGLWSAAKAVVATVASGIAEVVTYETIRDIQAQHLDKQLTPAVLADMVVRNILSNSSDPTTTPLLENIDGHDVYAEAAFSGIDVERMNALILDTGESYGIIDALRLYNRGSHLYQADPGPNYEKATPLYVKGPPLEHMYGITEDELNTVIHYSRIRDQFTADLLKLSKNTLSGADAVEIAVKQIMSPEDAQELYAAAGGMPEQFQMLVDSAGDSAGVQHAVGLYAHGALTEGQLAQIVGMSRMNHRFYYLTEGSPPYTAPLNLKWLSAFEVHEAVKMGMASSAQAVQWLTEEGYPPDQVAAFAGVVGGVSTTGTKQETETMVLTEYAAGQISELDAKTALTNLGYSDAAIPFFLRYADAKAGIAARNTVVSRIKESFLLNLVSSDQATTELSQVGVSQKAIVTYLADWTAERSLPHTALTSAEIGWFFEHGFIDLIQAQQYWAMKGFTQGDIELLVKRYTAATTP